MNKKMLLTGIVCFFLIQASLAYVIQGYVTGQGAPVENAQITVFGIPGNVSQGNVLTDSNGYYTITPPSSAFILYGIKVDPPSAYFPDNKVFPVGDLNVDFNLVPANLITVSGHVADSLGNDLNSVEVRFFIGSDPIGSVTTDSNGDYSRTLGDGLDYNVSTWFPPYLEASQSFTAFGSDVNDLDFVLYLDCNDSDGDGFNDASCGGADCDDNDSSVNPGAIESCNGIDDNCDGSIDESFDFANDLSNCGSCGNTCSLYKATSMCVLGVCEIDACDKGYRNRNKNPSDGCEEKIKPGGRIPTRGSATPLEPEEEQGSAPPELGLVEEEPEPGLEEEQEESGEEESKPREEKENLPVYVPPAPLLEEPELTTPGLIVLGVTAVTWWIIGFMAATAMFVGTVLLKRKRRKPFY